jgi:hypothetical protein
MFSITSQTQYITRKNFIRIVLLILLLGLVLAGLSAVIPRAALPVGVVAGIIAILDVLRSLEKSSRIIILFSILIMAVAIGIWAGTCHKLICVFGNYASYLLFQQLTPQSCSNGAIYATAIGSCLYVGLSALFLVLVIEPRFRS